MKVEGSRISVVVIMKVGGTKVTCPAAKPILDLAKLLIKLGARTFLLRTDTASTNFIN
jgi:hypothetical protein